VRPSTDANIVDPPAAYAVVPLSSGMPGRNREAVSKSHDERGAVVTEKS